MTVERVHVEPASSLRKTPAASSPAYKRRRFERSTTIDRTSSCVGMPRPALQVRPPFVERTTPSSRVPAQTVLARRGSTASDVTVSWNRSPVRRHDAPPSVER
jgi:hypothetical protein